MNLKTYIPNNKIIIIKPYIIFIKNKKIYIKKMI